MAFSHGTAARVWIDGFPAACNLNEFGMEGTVDTAETTTLCKSRKTYIPGLEDATVSMSGFFEINTIDPETTFDEFLSARVRTSFPVVFAPQGGELVGEGVYQFTGFMTSYSVNATVDEAVSTEMEFQSSLGWQHASVLQPEITETTTGEGGSHDNLVSTSNGGSAVLSVISATGTTPELDVLVEHSADDTIWATLATFSTQTEQNAEYVEFSGTVERYTRVSWTISGTTPEFVFQATLNRN